MKKLMCSFTMALLAGLASGACETSKEEVFTKSCRRVEAYFSLCRNLSTDEGETYAQSCVARGKKVVKSDENCGELWTDAYACVADLSCEDFELWRTTSHDDPMIDYPCGDEEEAFLAECPDLPLWRDD